jgi:peroxiredoxin
MFLMGGILVGVAAGIACFASTPAFPADPTAPSHSQEIEDQGPNEPAPTITSTNIPEAPMVGYGAPDFTLTNLDGKSVHLRDFRGRVVVINFWATWCEPCRTEMPIFQSAYRVNQPLGLEILAVNFDEPRSEVQEFRDQMFLGLTMLLDPGGVIQRLYRVSGYPTTFFVDREGVIRAQHVGDLNESQLDEYLESVGIGG